MSRTLLIVGAGGFLGSVGRYYASQLIFRYFPSSFPYGTLAVNIAGCFLIGIIYALSAKGNIISPEWRLFLATGFCGGFTTFSSFAYENVSLLRDGELFYTFMYLAISIFIGFLAAYAGILLIKFL